MAGYTRQSTFADGDIIQAADFNDEYNQLVNAFDNTTGHSHDGTAAEGPVIGLIGDPGVAAPINKVVVDDTNNRVGVFVDAGGLGSSVEQVRIQDGAVLPVTTNDIDIGSSSLKFKDGYFAGDVIANNISSTSYNSDIIPDTDDAYDLGSVTNEWKDLYIDGVANIDSLVADTADIDAGTIDGVIIGGTTAAAGTFTNLTATGNTVLGDAATDTVTITADVDSDIIPSADNTYDLGASGSEWKDIYIDGVAYVDSIAMPTTTVTDILDEDTLSSDSDTALATQQSIKAYVDAQVTAQDLDFQGDSGGALSIDLDSETLTIAGGTGIDTSGSGNTLTVAIDSTVATKTYVSSQTDLVNDTTPQLGGDLSTNSNDILFADNDVASFGAGGDLQIYHDTLNSYISERGTGNLYLGANGNIELFKHLSTDRMAKFITDGAVELYYANSKKIETTTDGVTVTGKAVADELDVDNITINGNTISSTDTNGDITLDPNGTGNVLLGNYEFDVDQTVGASEDNYVLTYDDATGHISLEAAAAGGISDVVSDTTPQLGGDLDTNGNDILFADNDKAIFGTGSDLEIYHSGLESFINDAGAGSLLLQTGGSTKVQVVSGGIIITGDVQADTATIASLNYPTSDGTSGQVLTTNGSGTLSFQNVTETDPSALAFAIALG